MNPRQQVQVLLVEDDPSDVFALKKYFSELSEAEFELNDVGRLQDALNFLQTQSCEVLLLDLDLPDSQGVETFTRIHKAAPDIPVLVLARSDDETVDSFMLERGAQDYLVKTHLQAALLGKAIRYAMQRQHATVELRLQAARLRASEARFRSLVEAAIDAVFVVDTIGKVRYVNPAAGRMFSRTAEDLLSGGFPFPLLPGRATDIEITASDGKNRSAELRLSETEWDGERIRLAWLRDVTENKHTDEALARAEKMQALGTLAGGIAHDFNNILLSVSGNAKLALEELRQDNPAYDKVLEIAKAGSRAAALTKKIQSFSQRQETRHAVVQIQPILEGAFVLLRATLPARIEIRKNLPENLPAVSADTSQIQQIMVNLGTNAAEAIGERSGALEISASSVHLNGNSPALSANLPHGDYVKVSVTDTGTGIEKNNLSRVFEPFFTTKAPGRGTGMGLAIVHGIMKNHLGEVTVYSEVGKGTVFNLYFPAAAKESVDVRPATMPLKGTGQHILYVDDEEPLVLLITRTLKRLGYEVTGFTDPLEVLRALRQQPCKFHALITDLSMPQMSGTALAQEALQLCPNLPVIITSGYLRPQDQEVARRVGVKELILKPDTIEELGNVLHRLLAASQDTPQSPETEATRVGQSQRAGAT